MINRILRASLKMLALVCLVGSAFEYVAAATKADVAGDAAHGSPAGVSRASESDELEYEASDDVGSGGEILDDADTEKLSKKVEKLSVAGDETEDADYSFCYMASTTNYSITDTEKTRRKRRACAATAAKIVFPYEVAINTVWSKLPASITERYDQLCVSYAVVRGASHVTKAAARATFLYLMYDLISKLSAGEIDACSLTAVRAELEANTTMVAAAAAECLKAMPAHVYHEAVALAGAATGAVSGVPGLVTSISRAVGRYFMTAFNRTRGWYAGNGTASNVTDADDEL